MLHGAFYHVTRSLLLPILPDIASTTILSPFNMIKGLCFGVSFVPINSIVRKRGVALAMGALRCCLPLRAATPCASACPAAPAPQHRLLHTLRYFMMDTTDRAHFHIHRSIFLFSVCCILDTTTDCRNRLYCDLMVVILKPLAHYRSLGSNQPPS